MFHACLPEAHGTQEHFTRPPQIKIPQENKVKKWKQTFDGGSFNYQAEFIPTCKIKLGLYNNVLLVTRKRIEEEVLKAVVKNYYVKSIGLIKSTTKLGDGSTTEFLNFELVKYAK